MSEAGVAEAKIADRLDDNNAFASIRRLVDAPDAALFTSLSRCCGKDTVMARLSLAALSSESVSGRIGYHGQFGSDLRDNAFDRARLTSVGGT